MLFLSAGVNASVVDSLDLQDCINGHCETCAAALSEHVLALLQMGTVPAEEALTAGTEAMIAALNAGSTAEQIALLFGPEARSRADDSRGRGRAMWSSATCVDDVLPPVRFFDDLKRAEQPLSVLSF